MAFKMKGNPMKLGSIASKSTMKLKDKVMKMKKEAAMKMKKESMAKMKEAMAKMKKDPMMMKKGSPMEMAKKARKTIKKAASEGMSEAAQEMKKAAPTKILGKVVKAAKKAHKGLVKGGANVVKKAAGALSMKKGAPMKQAEPQYQKGGSYTYKGKNYPEFASLPDAAKKIIYDKNVKKYGNVHGKGAMKQKMNMVKGPDGKMVPDFAVDGKGANDMKKSGAKMKKKSPNNLKKKSPNKGRFIKAMKAGDFKSAGKILKREGKAILAGTRATASDAANPTLAGTKTSFDIGYKREKQKQAKKPVKITKRKPIKVGRTTISFRGEGDKPTKKS
jgi:hypothetical protein